MACTGREFWITLWGNYFDSIELDGVRVDGYFPLNGSTTYEFDLSCDTSGLAFIRFFNLLDDKHREHPQGDVYGAVITGGLEFIW